MRIKRRLAGAVFAEKRVHRSLPHDQVRTVERQDPTESLANAAQVNRRNGVTILSARE